MVKKKSSEIVLTGIWNAKDYKDQEDNINGPNATKGKDCAKLDNKNPILRYPP